MEVFPLFASPLVQIKIEEDIDKLNDVVSKEVLLLLLNRLEVIMHKCQRIVEFLKST